MNLVFLTITLRPIYNSVNFTNTFCLHSLGTALHWLSRSDVAHLSQGRKMSKPVIKESDMGTMNVLESHKRWTLNFTDIVNNNNKFYNLEIIETNDHKFYLYTVYGRVGASGAKEYRICSDMSDAEKEALSIIKSKSKKGYVEVKLAKADIGSSIGKSKVDSSVSVESLKKLGATVIEKDATPSKLTVEVQDLVRTWFGATQEFVELNLDTKKCPLGQLSIDQIDKAKLILDEARGQVHAKKPDTQELNKLTSQYYSNIPHVLGHKINADVLRFDDDSKIDKALDILDVFADAKNVQAVISKRTAVDSQYDTLKADLEFIDPANPTWKWLDAMLLGTRASNHSGLGKLKTHKIFQVNRHDEEKHWLEASEKIAKECGKFVPSPVYAKWVESRPDLDKGRSALYKAANILPGWHGTRRANMIGITTKGLLIRPSGVAHAGSMYGDGIYWAVHSTKSINYCDVKGSYWAQGNNKTAYLFLADVAFGNQHMAGGSHFYSKQNIKPAHSVWAKSGGSSGLYNDELITYTPTGKDQQHRIRYIIEFETQAK
jgi:poly [ADP-ribose] polymerase